jgi:hypothetical protein
MRGSRKKPTYLAIVIINRDLIFVVFKSCMHSFIRRVSDDSSKWTTLDMSLGLLDDRDASTEAENPAGQPLSHVGRRKKEVGTAGRCVLRDQ